MTNMLFITRPRFPAHETCACKCAYEHEYVAVWRTIAQADKEALAPCGSADYLDVPDHLLEHPFALLLTREAV